MDAIRRTSWLLLGLLILSLAAGSAPAAVDPALADYVQRVGERVLKGQAAVGQIPRTYRVRESTAVAAGLTEPGVIEVTTGLLATLGNEAQLANVLAYEQARAARVEPRRQGQGSGVGERVAQAATAGAATAAVGATVSEALRRENHIVRAAATGGAAAATLALVYAAWPRRHNRPEVRQDDEAAKQGIRAVVSAGYDGWSAAQAWGRITAGSPLGGPEGGYGHPKADRKRAKAQRAVLDRADVRTGGETGADSYRAAVLGKLRPEAPGTR